MKTYTMIDEELDAAIDAEVERKETNDDCLADYQELLADDSTFRAEHWQSVAVAQGVPLFLLSEWVTAVADGDIGEMRKGHIFGNQDNVVFSRAHQEHEIFLPPDFRATPQQVVEFDILDAETEPRTYVVTDATVECYVALDATAEWLKERCGGETMLPGTVNSGTMRPQDLIPAFGEELERMKPCNPLVAEVDATGNLSDDSEWWMSDDADDLLERLFGALDSLADPGWYFGAHEGDGADFGFWEAEPCD